MEFQVHRCFLVQKENISAEAAIELMRERFADNPPHSEELQTQKSRMRLLLIIQINPQHEHKKYKLKLSAIQHWKL